jgi:probable phosphoglycerate mutase
MPAQVYLLRHGETAWSLTGQHTGRTDLPLTANGERQASRLRAALQGVRFAHVLTSPLQRARRTCELAGLGVVTRAEPDLMEWDYGDYEGETTAAIHRLRPGWDIFRDGCPNGESPATVGERADRIAGVLRALDGIVAVFSHGQFLRVLAMRWIGLSVGEGRHFALDTASISILGYEHDTDPAITLWNASDV